MRGHSRIFIRLKGGLGNQMFQYAHARDLGIRLNRPVTLDLSELRDVDAPSRTPREYGLDWFRIAAPELEAAVSSAIRTSIVFRARNRLNIALLSSGVAPAGDVLLTGYWLGEHSFSHAADALRTEFQPRNPPRGRSEELAEQIRSSTAIGVHVRRGDYVGHKRFDFCRPAYYEAAIQTIAKATSADAVFVFSDDPYWCRHNLRWDLPTVYVEPGLHPAEDLWLLSRCNHQVISNSTFSWWAAWLNPFETRKIAAPGPWSRDPEGRVPRRSGIIPDDWILMEASTGDVIR